MTDKNYKTSDKREVVSYDLDTEKFEKGVDRLIKAMEKIEESEATKNVTGMFDKMQEGESNFSTDNIETSLSSLEDKFGAMNVIMTTGLVNTTYKILDLIDTVKYKLFDNVINGFEEYTMQMDSIQTAFSNTHQEHGTELKEIMQYYDDLNVYADKTIFNFGEMTRAAAIFTSTGLRIDLAANAVKGISNLTAYLGGTTEQASSAYYNLANAIDQGYMSLYQWNAMVHSGVGGKVLADQMTEAAKSLKIPIDEYIKEDGSFRMTLDRGWASREVILRALQQVTTDITAEEYKQMGYTEEQVKKLMEIGKAAEDSATNITSFGKLMSTSAENIGSGWALTFRSIIGQYDEAKNLFTDIGKHIIKTIDESSEYRNNIIRDWNKLGGRDLAVEAIMALIRTYEKLRITVGQAIIEIFPPIDGKRLYDMTKTVTDFLRSLEPSKDSMKDLYKIFRGLASVIEIPIDFIREFIKFLSETITPTKVFKGNVLETGAAIGEFFYNLRNKLLKDNAFAKFFIKVGSIVNEIKIKVLELTKVFKNSDIYKYLKNIFDKIMGSKYLAVFKKNISEFFGKLKTNFKWEDILGSVQEGIKIFIDKLKSIYISLKPILSVYADMAKEIFKVFKDALKNLSEDFSWDKLISGLELVIKLLVAHGIIEYIDDIGASIKALAVIAANGWSSMNVLFRAVDEWSDVTANNSMLIMAGAILMLATAAVLFASIDDADLLRAGTAITTLVGILSASMMVLSSTVSTFSKFLSSALIPAILLSFSISLILLVFAFNQVKDLDMQTIGRGLVLMLGTLVAISVGAKAIEKSVGNFIGLSAGLGIFAISLLMLVGVFKLLEKIKTESIFESVEKLLLIGGGVLAISKAAERISLKGMIGLMFMAGAIALIKIAFKSLEDLKIDAVLESLKNLLIISVGIVALSAASTLISLSGLVSLYAMTGAIFLLGKSLESIKDLNSVSILKTVGVMTISIIMLNAALLGISPRLLIGIGVMYAASALIFALGSALQFFEKIKVETIGKTLLAIAGVFLTLAGVSMLLESVSSGILVFIGLLIGISSAALLFGLSVLAVGAGVYLLSSAVSNLLRSLREFATAMSENLEDVSNTMEHNISKMLDTLERLLPKFSVFFSKVLLEILKGGFKILPQLNAFMTEIFYSMLETANRLLPKFIEVVTNLIGTLVVILIRSIPGLADEFYTSITSLFYVLSKHSSEYVDAIMTLILNILNAFNNAFDKFHDQIMASLRITALNLVVMLSDVFAEGFVGALAVLPKTFVESLLLAIDTEILGGALGFKRVGTDFVYGFVNNMFGEQTDKIINWAGDSLLGKLLNQMRNSKKLKDLKNFAEGLGSALGSSIVQGIEKGNNKNEIGSAINSAQEALASEINKISGSENAISIKIIPNLDQSALDGILGSIATAQVSIDGATGNLRSTGSITQNTYNYQQKITAVQPLRPEDIYRNTRSLLGRRLLNSQT